MLRSRLATQARLVARHNLPPSHNTPHGRLPTFRPVSTSPPPRSPNLLLNGALAAGILAAAAAAYYYESSPPDSDSKEAATGTGETFTINLGSGRRAQSHTFPKLSNAACETKLHEHETGQVIGRPGNPVMRWDRNWVGSNEPCEDRSAVDVVHRKRSAKGLKTGLGSWLSGSSSSVDDSQAVLGQKDLVLFSMIDGHGGWATSELLSKVLHPTLTLSLAALQAGVVPGNGGLLDKVNPANWIGGPVWTKENVMKAISSAYTQLDDNIVQTPVRLIPTLRSTPTDPSSPTPRSTLAALAEPADNGACSLSAVFDSEEGDLYVALAGDCRAVAGWEKNGVWRCDVLSEDQMGENESEVQRMRKEHPGEENTVIMRGRVHGGLQPTRAFGDASYKWTQGEAAVICDALNAEGKKARRPRPFSKTPPYVTARPEITHRKIKGEGGEKLKFVIMATDGLWDRISSEESTLLLASYMRHPTHPEIHKSTLPLQFPLTPPLTNRPYPADPLPGTAEKSNGTWVFEGDSNAATHLIRNCLGGGDRKARNELLSVTGEVTRYLRDDITVTVIFFDENTKSA